MASTPGIATLRREPGPAVRDPRAAPRGMAALRSFGLPEGGELEAPRSVALIWAPAGGRYRSAEGRWQELGPADYGLVGPGSRLHLGPWAGGPGDRINVLTAPMAMLAEIKAEIRSVSRLRGGESDHVKSLPFRPGVHRQVPSLAALLGDLDQAASLGIEDPAWLGRHGRLVWERLLSHHCISEAGRSRPGHRAAGRPGVLAGRLAKVRRMIEKEFDRSLNLEAMAAAACVSRFHFLREFRNAFGETPYQLLIRVRLETARKLLARGDLSVQEVSRRVGFSSADGFYRAFKRRYSRPPSDYLSGT